MTWNIVIDVPYDAPTRLQWRAFSSPNTDAHLCPFQGPITTAAWSGNSRTLSRPSVASHQSMDQCERPCKR
eukprot:5179355-Prorocentrum_lima.AAC.1